MAIALGHKLTVTPVVVTVGAASARNATALTAGAYLVSSDTACYIRQGDVTVTVSATVASRFLEAGDIQILAVDGATSAHVAVIQDAAAGSLFIQRLAPAIG